MLGFMFAAGTAQAQQGVSCGIAQQQLQGYVGRVNQAAKASGDCFRFLAAGFAHGARHEFVVLVRCDRPKEFDRGQLGRLLAAGAEALVLVAAAGERIAEECVDEMKDLGLAAEVDRKG